jgi:hypothetical protein
MFRRVKVIFQVTVKSNDVENPYCASNAANGAVTVATKPHHVVQ